MMPRAEHRADALQDQPAAVQPEVPRAEILVGVRGHGHVCGNAGGNTKNSSYPRSIRLKTSM